MTTETCRASVDPATEPRQPPRDTAPRNGYATNPRRDVVTISGKDWLAFAGSVATVLVVVGIAWGGLRGGQNTNTIAIEDAKQSRHRIEVQVSEDRLRRADEIDKIRLDTRNQIAAMNKAAAASNAQSIQLLMEVSKELGVAAARLDSLQQRQDEYRGELIRVEDKIHNPN